MRTRLKARAVLATVFYGLLQVSMASISFPEIQPIMGFPQLCTKAYSTTITDCELDEFPLLGGSGCSANCQIALEAAGTFIQRACASLSAPGDSLIGQIFIGNVIDFLCTPTSSQTTTTMTTAAASPSSPMSMASDTMTTSSTASQAASSAVTTSSSSAASVTSAGSTTTTTTKESSSVTKSSSASRSTSVSSSSSLTTTLSTSSTSTSTSSSTSTTRTSSATQASSAGNGNTGGSGGGSPFDEPFSTGTGVLVAPHHQLLFLCLVGLIFILR